MSWSISRIRGRLGSLFLLCSLSLASVLACSDDDDGSIPEHSHGGAPPELPDVPRFTDGGLDLQIDSVEVSEEGVCEVEFTITDGDGTALDLDGELTRGAVSANFILSWLGENEDGESTQYTAYTLRTKVSNLNGEEAVQSSYDRDGSFEKIELGKYRYTFGTEIEIDEERAELTHTLGVYATRSVDGVRYVDNELHSWVPDGSEVETMQDVVVDEACNSCHTRLEFHGGSRRGVGMCNLCHTEENSINPETGNTIDFQVMIHKIHMGEDLPSVQAGEPYTFVGYMDHVVDYSEVKYPWDMRDCTTCHQGSQGDRWLTRPTEKPCSSCHDRTYFGAGEPPEGWTKHTAGPRDDSECVVCHGEDSLEPIRESHLTALTDPERPEIAAEVIDVTDTAPGQTLSVEMEFTVDGRPHDIVDDPFDRIRMRIFGPTTDVTGGWEEVISDAPACEGVVEPPCLEEEGTHFIYHSVTPIPEGASGSYVLGLDGRYPSETYGNIPFRNVTQPFAVTGEVMERREVVSREKCNSCHGNLAEHGGSYTEPEYCLYCHNTSNYQHADEGLLPGEEITLNSINFKDMIHRVHAGTSYPAPLSDCQQCHLEGTYGVPLPYPNLQASLYAVLSCEPGAMECVADETEGMGGMGGTGSSSTVEVPYSVPPESAACTSCHSSPDTLAHVETNTGTAGEACGTCHGSGKQYDVNVAHAQSP